MISVLPVDTTFDWSQCSVALDGVTYQLELAWNTRAAGWSLSLYKEDGTPLACGVAITVDYPLLRRFVDPDLPTGDLIAVDTSGNGQEIAAKEDLGTRVQLMYLTADEVA